MLGLSISPGQASSSLADVDFFVASSCSCELYFLAVENTWKNAIAKGEEEEGITRCGANRCQEVFCLVFSGARWCQTVFARCLPGGARWCLVAVPGGAGRWSPGSCQVVPGGARWRCRVVPGEGAGRCQVKVPGGARRCCQPESSEIFVLLPFPKRSPGNPPAEGKEETLE